MNLDAIGARLAAVLLCVVLWICTGGTSARWCGPVLSFAEKMETRDAVVYSAHPQDSPGAQEQRQEEARKEAESWEMLRRLTIEIERPNTHFEPSLAPNPKSQSDR